MSLLSVFAALLISLAVSSLAQADGTQKDPLVDICNSHVEGSARGIIGTTKNVRINIVCTDENRIAASAYIDGLANISLTYATVSRGILILSQFPLDVDLRKNATTGSMTYVKLNLESFKRGELFGYMMNGHLTFPLVIKGKVSQTFPSVSSMASKSVRHSDFIGLYRFQMMGQTEKGAAVTEDVEMWMDINNGMPLVNLKIKIPLKPSTEQKRSTDYSGGAAIHFIDGAVWDGKIGFGVTTVFGDTSSNGATLWNLRGRVIDVGILEIFVIDPVNGLRGPFIAKKVADPGAFLNMELGEN